MEVINHNNGEPVKKIVEVCYIETPGDKTQRPPLRVTEEIKRRFPEEYLAWKDGDEMPIHGTPLNLLGIGERLSLEMQATGIRTVEDLAGMSDGNVRNFPNGQSLRKKASNYLANKVPDESEGLKAELADLKTQMAAMMEMMKANAGQSEPVRRGRPPKEEAKTE